MTRAQLNTDIDTNLPSGAAKSMASLRSELKIMLDYTDQQDAGLKALIDAIPGSGSGITYTRYKVKVGGTPGTDCDYTSITAAINAVDAGTITKDATHHVILEILNGTYLEHGPTNTGIYLRDYVHLLGESREGVIIKNADEGSTGPAEAGFSTIVIPASCWIQNMTIHAYRAKYCVHADISGFYKLDFYNVTFKHFGGQTGSLANDIGAGLRQGQQLNFVNCSGLGGGIYAHNNESDTARSLTIPIGITVSGCFFRQFLFIDFEEYAQNRITIENSFIKTLDLRADASVYNGTPSATANRGYKPPYTQLAISGTQIGELIMDAETLVLMAGKIPRFVGFNDRVTNKNGSTLSQGYAVRLLADAGEPNAYTNLDEIGFREVGSYNGGIFLGFLMEDIANNASGMVQISGNPQAFFNNGSGAVAYGDALELNTSGQVQKKSTGDTVGYALAGASASGLLKIKMK